MRFSVGDRVEIIDAQHEDYGQKGTIVGVPDQHIDAHSKRESGDPHILRVKLEGSGKHVTFYRHASGFENQIRIVQDE